jgi:hypothetical protein
MWKFASNRSIVLRKHLFHQAPFTLSCEERGVVVCMLVAAEGLKWESRRRRRWIEWRKVGTEQQGGKQTEHVNIYEKWKKISIASRARRVRRLRRKQTAALVFVLLAKLFSLTSKSQSSPHKFPVYWRFASSAPLELFSNLMCSTSLARPRFSNQTQSESLGKAL